MADQRVDVIVVGLGSAGAAAATFFARKGHRVLAIDKRAIGETGARWVNSVPRWCFDDAGVAQPTGDELFGGHAPDADHIFHLVAPGGAARLPLKAPPVLHVDMRRFVDRLAREALGAGVEVLRGSLREVVLEQARVVGVRVETDAGERRIDAKLIVDASGIGGAVRRRVPSLAASWPDAEEGNRCVAAEFQYAVRDKAALEAFLKSHGALPGHDVAFPGCAGGYSTLTLFTTKSLDTVGLLTGSIPATGVMDAGALLDAFVASAPWLGERLFGGRGAIPVRRPYDVLASSGVALIGDAACQVHAAHGSGVGMGLLAARVLADAAQDDPGSDASHHAYTRNFHRAHGGLLTAADAFRRFIQQASREDLALLLTAGLLDEKLAQDGLAQRVTRPDVSMALSIAPKAARVPGLALRFLPLAAKSGLLDLVGGSMRMRGLVNALVGSAPAAAGKGRVERPVGDAEGRVMKAPPIPPVIPRGAEFAFGKSPFHAKGVLYLGTQSFFAEHNGLDALVREIEEPELREFITQRFLAASLYDVTPVPTLIAYEARALRMSVENYLLHRTRHQANKDLGGVYAWLLRLASPALIARHLPRIMLQMFDFATVEIEREEPTETVAVMKGLPLSLVPWLEVGLSVYAETALKLAGARASTSTTKARTTGSRAGLELVELTVSLRWR